MSKWASEENWRSAVATARENIARFDLPGVVYYHHGNLDEGYTRKLIAKFHGSLERIWMGGEPEWRERYVAEGLPR